MNLEKRDNSNGDEFEKGLDEILDAGPASHGQNQKITSSEPSALSSKASSQAAHNDRFRIVEILVRVVAALAVVGLLLLFASQVANR